MSEVQYYGYCQCRDSVAVYDKISCQYFCKKCGDIVRDDYSPPVERSDDNIPTIWVKSSVADRLREATLCDLCNREDESTHNCVQ